MQGSQISGRPADAALAFVSSHIVKGCLTIHVVPRTPRSQHETHHLLRNLSAAVNWLKPEPEDQRTARGALVISLNNSFQQTEKFSFWISKDFTTR